MGRPARDETSYSKESFIFSLCLLDHIPGVVAIVGMPLHFLPYDHGRLALDETAYPAFENSSKQNILLFFFFIKCFPIYTQRVVQPSLRVGMVEEVLTSQQKKYALILIQ